MSEEEIPLLLKYYGPFLRHAFTIPPMTVELMYESLMSGQLSFHSIPLKGVGKVDHIIDARGPSHHIVNNPLLKVIEEQGYISQHIYSGIKVDQDTCKAVDAKGRCSTLYAIGVTTFGSCFSVYSINGCVAQTVRVAKGLLGV